MNCISPIKSYNIRSPLYGMSKTGVSVPFKGTPKYLSQSCYPCITYDRLKDGSYLDIHDDSFAPDNKDIRSKNLSFLDKIPDEEKESFINYYCKLTSFPDLKKVSEKIEAEFINSIKKVSRYYNDKKYDCIAAGYDDTCSVGKRMALPGSDLDKAFIVLKGSGNLFEDIKIVDNFKSALWSQTDQRILSYNHDTSFPTVYTTAQIKHLINNINDSTFYINFDYKHLKDLVENEYLNLEKAAEYNIEISKKFKEPSLSDKYYTLNKENVKNFAFFLEPLRDGKILIDTPELCEIKKDLSEYDFYKFSNVTQIKAMRNAVNSGREQKTKILLRKNLINDFYNWDTDKKFDFVKTLIKYSCEDENDFMEYFRNDRDIKKKYRRLLSLITKDNPNYYYNPEFVIKKDSAAIKLSDNIYVDLYKGFLPNILWINSTNSDNIKQVLLHLDKIRKIKIFNNINTVQFPCPDRYINDCTRTRFKTSDQKTIYERKI